MLDLFSSLGIEWRILIAQIINFAILVVVLKIFLFKPIIKVLNERKRKIDEYQIKFRQIDESFLKSQEDRKNIIIQAKEESSRILKQAEISANQIKDEIIKSAKLEALKIIESGKSDIREVRSSVQADIINNIGTLIAIAIEKNFEDVLDDKAKNKLQEGALRSLSLSLNNQKKI